MKWRNFSRFEKIYTPSQINEVLEIAVDKDNIIKNNKKIVYYNMPCSFDIETTSFFRSTGIEEEKIAIMYEWTLGINGAVIIGRTWNDFLYVYNFIKDYLTLSKEKRLVIYVHNLSYEFQFIRKWLEWENIFALDVRKPCYALTKDGVEFRCSYLLSGYSLEKLGDELKKYPIKKMSGDLDYDLIRNNKTPLSEKELKYCENDVRVVMSYIQEKIEDDGDITRIPYTKTGYVRNYCRKCCMYNGSHKKDGDKYLKYKRLMDSLTIEPYEYEELKRAFQGGFTHANAQYSGLTFKDVGSFDFTSSYPYVMISEKFPMGKGKLIKISGEKEFEKYLKDYCCLFDIEFFNIESKNFIEHPISSSRCYKKENIIEDNGRVVSGKFIRTTLTEQDFKIIKSFYNWEKIRIYNFIIYPKAYLPTDFVKSILKLYQDKTQLKGIEDKSIEYMKSKSMLNSCYGMTVTDICREIIKYEYDWNSEKTNINDSLAKYNKSKKRFLFYPWGVWITAYARRNLFSGIISFGNDYIYSDTDSIKAKNIDKHMDYINRYNEIVKIKLQSAAEFHGLNFEEFEPKSIKNETKLIGIWDYEGMYDKFKTLGAKRYIYEKDGKVNITVSGVNKNKAMPYLLEKYKDSIFDNFEDGLYIPSNYTGKNTHTYIDDEKTGSIIDYLGNESKYYEKSSIHLSPVDFTLSLSSAYIEYLKGIEVYEN